MPDVLNYFNVLGARDELRQMDYRDLRAYYRGLRVVSLYERDKSLAAVRMPDRISLIRDEIEYRNRRDWRGKLLSIGAGLKDFFSIR